MTPVATTARVDGVAPASAAILAGQQERLAACVHCGFCISVCPTYTRLGDEADSPRGRIYLMRAVTEGRMAPDADAFATHIDRCLGCRACETVCPSGVEYGFLLERARAVIADTRGSDPATRALLGVFRHRLLSRCFMAAGRLLRDVGLAGALARTLPRRLARARFGLAMLAASRARGGVPAPGEARRPDEAPARSAPAGMEDPERAARPAPRTAGADVHRVAMLTGCVQSGLFGRVNRATLEVLQANGCEVVATPAQRCCGALHAHGGDLRGARELARANVDAFEATGVEAIIVNAAGCGAAMKAYGELLADEPTYAERARSLAARVRDISEYLDEIGPVEGAPLPLAAAYDAPCHLHHAQRVQEAPLRVLRAAVPGLEVRPLAHADECCGGAGIYGLLHPDLGGRILADKIADIQSTEGDVLLTGNPGCAMQMGAGLLMAGDARPVLHPVELLAESYRRLGARSPSSDRRAGS